MMTELETATFGAGCFWCASAVFQDLKGVQRVISGYEGGDVLHPTYQEVCEGDTGHAEVVQIIFDPEIISFADLLHIFWRIHNPTTLNRQGADTGAQYRSAIFYQSDAQKEVAEKSKAETDAADLYSNPIVTEITPTSEFYEAEIEHQNFYRQNPEQIYCRVVIGPKVREFRKAFGDKLKGAQAV